MHNGAVTEATTIEALVGRYRYFLLDAYGVLVDSDGARPGAAALIERLRAADRALLVVTNDASKSPSAIARKLQGAGIAIHTHEVLGSGMLLDRFFRRRGLVGRRCLVLGPADAFAYVAAAGGVPVAWHDARGAEVVVLCDESGYPLLDGLDAALAVLLERLDADADVTLVVPNPDLVYPIDARRFGLAAGALAGMLERAVRARHPETTLRATRLGKPQPGIFRAALRRLGARDVRDVVMLGDQLATDIRGARRAGIDAALVLGGVGCWPVAVAPERAPTWVVTL